MQSGFYTEARSAIKKASRGRKEYGRFYMQKTDNEEVIEIDIQELLAVLLHRIWLIGVCGAVCGLMAFLISRFLIPPMYESSTSVYILNKNDGNTITYSDVQLGSTLTKDYARLITSRGVLEKVIESCALEESIEELEKRVSVETLSDTRLIVITVTDKSPLMACYIADEIREEASARIEEVMDIEAVNMVDAANLPEKPAKPSVKMWSVIGLLLGLFLCAGVLTVQFMTDDTVKTSEDIEKYLELSTLAMIPVMEEENGAKNRHGRRNRAKKPEIFRKAVTCEEEEYEKEEEYEEEYKEEEYEGDWTENREAIMEMAETEEA